MLDVFLRHVPLTNPTEGFKIRPKVLEEIHVLLTNIKRELIQGLASAAIPFVGKLMQVAPWVIQHLLTQCIDSSVNVVSNIAIRLAKRSGESTSHCACPVGAPCHVAASAPESAAGHGSLHALCMTLHHSTALMEAVGGNLGKRYGCLF